MRQVHRSYFHFSKAGDTGRGTVFEDAPGDEPDVEIWSGQGVALG